MNNYLFTMRFDGTRYHGWQVQKNALAVQQVFQDAVEAVLGRREDVSGCSRTDAGVHANMYCCHVKTERQITPEKLTPALNAHLPADIAVYGCREVPLDFHARYSCRSKEYIYQIWNSPCRNPFYENYALRASRRLDETMLREEAAAFLGTHDFSGFCSAKGSVEDTVRTITRFDVVRQGDLITFQVEADGFLYNMVRIMAGTMLSIAMGRIERGALPRIIESGDRNLAGYTAPARGLFLNRVNYEEEDEADACYK